MPEEVRPAFGLGAEPTMALSWPKVIESRPIDCDAVMLS